MFVVFYSAKLSCRSPRDNSADERRGSWWSLMLAYGHTEYACMLRTYFTFMG